MSFDPAIHTNDSLKNELKAIDDLVNEVQEMIYHVRWVEAFGKNGQMATDKALAEAVVSVFLQSEQAKKVKLW